MKKAIITTLILSLITGCASVNQPKIYDYKISSKTTDKEVQKIENDKGEKIYLYGNGHRIVKIEKLSKKYNSINKCEYESEIDVMELKKRINENSNESKMKGSYTEIYDLKNRINIEDEIKEKYKVRQTSKSRNDDFVLLYNIIEIDDSNDCYYSVAVNENPHKRIQTSKKGYHMSYNSEMVMYAILVGIVAIPVAIIVMPVVVVSDLVIKSVNKVID